jgi:hypothetical protein
MAKNKSRKRSMRRKRGGADAPNVPAAPNAPNAPNVPGATPNATRAPNAPATTGGKRKTRKVSKGASDWNKKVMEVYRDMKKKDSSVKLGAAMKRASQMKKRGEL